MPTPTAQDERVEVRALKGEYQFGFHDPDQSVFRAKKGLDQDIVEQISEIKKEPKWMRDSRLRALEIFLQKPLPTWGGNVAEIDFDDIYYYVKPSQGAGRTWEDVPENIKKTFDRLGIPEAERKFLAGVGAQYDSEVVYHSLKDIWNGSASSLCRRTRRYRNTLTSCRSILVRSFRLRITSLLP